MSESEVCVCEVCVMCVCEACEICMLCVRDTVCVDVSMFSLA